MEINCKEGGDSHDSHETFLAEISTTTQNVSQGVELQYRSELSRLWNQYIFNASSIYLKILGLPYSSQEKKLNILPDFF